MRLRKALRKIHRWVGLLAALWLLQLASTGLLLQHADDFNLTQKHVSSAKLLKWFGYGARQQIWHHNNNVLYQIDDVVGFNGQLVTLSAQIVGAVRVTDLDAQQLWVVATRDALYWFNQQGETSRQLDDFDGVPTPISGLYSEDNNLYIQVKNQWFAMQAAGDFIPTTQNHVADSTGRSMTSTEQNQYFATALTNKLSYDKVLHGIHAGIQGSKWLNSLSALALFYLCFSGIYLFIKQPSRKR